MSMRPPGCCGDFIGEANRKGDIDLRTEPDAGPEVLDDARTDG